MAGAKGEMIPVHIFFGLAAFIVAGPFSVAHLLVFSPPLFSPLGVKPSIHPHTTETGTSSAHLIPPVNYLGLHVGNTVSQQRVFLLTKAAVLKCRAGGFGGVGPLFRALLGLCATRGACNGFNCVR